MKRTYKSLDVYSSGNSVRRNHPGACTWHLWTRYKFYRNDIYHSHVVPVLGMCVLTQPLGATMNEKRV